MLEAEKRSGKDFAQSGNSGLKASDVRSADSFANQKPSDGDDSTSHTLLLRTMAEYID